MKVGFVKFWAIALSFFFCISLISCQTTTLKTQAAKESQLVLSTLTDPKTFNYANNQLFPNIFLFSHEGLTRENGMTGAIEPALAESWTISADKKQIVFTLREGLKWSDGQPLTADDVEFTYKDVIFNPAVPAEVKDQLRIGTKAEFPQVRKLDDRRVEFRLPEPFAPFLWTTSAPDGTLILPKHALADTLKSKGSDGNLKFLSTWNTDTNPANIIVNGAYVLESYTAGQRLVFRRNPHYWRKDAAGKPLPYIDRIVWQFIESTDTQLLRFRSGDLDIMGDARPLRPEYYSLLKREEQRGKFQVSNGGAWSGITYLAFNQNRAKHKNGQPIVDPIKSRWFTNLAFRQAVAYAIDRERMNTNIFRGLGILQTSPISVQSSYFLPSEQVKRYNFDPQKAKDLLQSAGFQYNAQGQLFDRDSNRVRFTLLTNAGNKVREAIGAQVRQDLGNIGIQVDFAPLNFNTFGDKLSTSREWDAHIIGFTGGVEPHGTANFWMSGGGSHYFNLKQQPGQSPLTDWQATEPEQEIDRLFAAAARETDEAKRKELYAQFQRLVQEELPIMFLVHESALMVARDTIEGVKFSGLPSWGLWNLAELKLKADAD